jgi:dienelactone hydrolase
MPLIIIDKKGKKFIPVLTNFDYKKISLNFHIIVISMPNTPTEVEEGKLSKQLCNITDSLDQHSYASSYLKNNYAENYTRRAKEVINFLSTQKWVDNKKIILFGHSQGSKIVISAALNNPKVFKVGYASGNPMGRIDQLVREQRKLAQEGKISLQQSQDEIESIYSMWQKINELPNDYTINEFGDPNKTWTSFSKPQLDNMLKLNKPLFVAYGTNDITASFCDLLPIYFIREHKTNLTLKPYLGLEHNFFELNADGQPDYSKPHWQDVLNDFIKWVK